MLRKFLLACMVLGTFTIQTQAISINELNGSLQFKNVYEKHILMVMVQVIGMYSF